MKVLAVCLLVLLSACSSAPIYTTERETYKVLEEDKARWLADRPGAWQSLIDTAQSTANIYHRIVDANEEQLPALIEELRAEVEKAQDHRIRLHSYDLDFYYPVIESFNITKVIKDGQIARSQTYAVNANDIGDFPGGLRYRYIDKSTPTCRAGEYQFSSPRGKRVLTVTQYCDDRVRTLWESQFERILFTDRENIGELITALRR